MSKITNSMFESIRGALAATDEKSTGPANILKTEPGNTYTVRLRPYQKEPSKTFHHYQQHGWNSFATGQYVSAISPDGYALTLAPLGVSVAGIFSGTPINTSGQVDIAVGAPSIREGEQGSLYSVLPDTNISAIDFDKSTLTITAQITGEGIASSTTTLDISGTPGVKDGSGAGISTAFFDSFAPIDTQFIMDLVME